MKVVVVGAGLAGCEAACSLARRGFDVTLWEQKPERFSPAHKNPDFAELVCSNSLKSKLPDTAAGLLKSELALIGGVTLRAAENCSVAAGNALAVDRHEFSRQITREVCSHENITVKRGEFVEIDPDVPTIIASGPLTDGALADAIKNACGEQYLSFYDAAAPIVSADSLDMAKLFSASRYGEGEGDYLNSYMDKPQFELFAGELVRAQTATLKSFEYNVYEGCMPIEKLASRGEQAMRFGPMKPVGLRDPRTGHRPYAAVQLRRENAEGTLFNLVGFQTNLKFAEQRRVFSLIPGLENADFTRFGVMHRNTFLNSPNVLTPTLKLKSRDNLFFAGQITGFEGYVESAACGALCALFVCDYARGKTPRVPSENTMCGALLKYITTQNKNFQPMGANMGILPELPEAVKDKRLRYAALCLRAKHDMEEFYENYR